MNADPGISRAREGMLTRMTDGKISAAYGVTARTLHWITAALVLFMMPVGAVIMVFGLFQLPPIWSQDRPLSERPFVAHGLIGAAIAGLAAVHIGAARYHHFVRRDRVLMRMITG